MMYYISLITTLSTADDSNFTLVSSIAITFTKVKGYHPHSTRQGKQQVTSNVAL